MRPARTAVELCVDYIDKADSYEFGTVEEILREALHPYPDNLLVARRSGRSNRGPAANGCRSALPPSCNQCELSLRRLWVERIDLLYLHRIDPLCPSPTRWAR